MYGRYCILTFETIVGLPNMGETKRGNPAPSGCGLD